MSAEKGIVNRGKWTGNGMGEKCPMKYRAIKGYQGLRLKKEERDIRGLRRLRIRVKRGCW